MNQTIVGFDIDDVLANLVPEWLNRYNYSYDDNLRPEHILEWDMTKYVKSECGKKIYDILDRQMYDYIKPIITPIEVEMIRKIYKCRVIFITSSMKSTAGRKLQWLQDWGYLPKGELYSNDYIECSDKQLINVNVMIDDKPSTLEDFNALGKIGILFDRSWNKYYRNPNIIRVYNFSQILQTLDVIFTGMNKEK